MLALEDHARSVHEFSPFPARNAGPATSCLMQTPRSVTSDSRGGFYVTDSQYSTVRWVRANGTISTIIGRWVCAFVLKSRA